MALPHENCYSFRIPWQDYLFSAHPFFLDRYPPCPEVPVGASCFSLSAPAFHMLLRPVFLLPLRPFFRILEGFLTMVAASSVLFPSSCSCRNIVNLNVFSLIRHCQVNASPGETAPKMWVVNKRLNTRYGGLVPRKPVNLTTPVSSTGKSPNSPRSGDNSSSDNHSGRPRKPLKRSGAQEPHTPSDFAEPSRGSYRPRNGHVSFVVDSFRGSR